jgi:hypothetical protein
MAIDFHDISVVCDYVTIRSHREEGGGRVVRMCRFYHFSTRITLNISVMPVSKVARGEVILNASSKVILNKILFDQLVKNSPALHAVRRNLAFCHWALSSALIA